MTQALFIEVSNKDNQLNEEGKRRLNVSGVLRKLGVSRSGYNSWKNRPLSDHIQRKEIIKEKIKQIYDESHQNYGAPKLTEKLKSVGIGITEKTVGNYMREMGIKAQYIKPYIVTTIHSDFSTQLTNVLDEKFNPEEPNAAWCSDITYIWTNEGFVYLTSIMDLFSRKIIAWTLSETLEAKWVIETVNKAKSKRNITKPLVIHSDRGIQYVCSDYRQATEGMQTSYSKKAYPWDNACIESFHGLIKREWLNRFKILNYTHAHRLVFEYIETFYNTVRIHSHCNFKSPNQHEEIFRNEMLRYSELAS